MIDVPLFPRASVAAAMVVAMAGCGPLQADNEAEIAWEPPVTVATGNAYRGSWRMNESEFLYVDDPAVALAGDDSAVAWVDNEARDVFFNRYDGDGKPVFDDPVDVSGSPDTFSWLPRVTTLNGGDEVIVAWQEIAFTGGSHGGEIHVARSTDGGRSFADPVNLSETTAGAGKGRFNEQRWDNGSLALAADDNGRVYVAWTEYEGALRLAVSTDRGETFSAPIHVAGDDDNPVRAPDLAVGADRLWLAWVESGSAGGSLSLAGFDPEDRSLSSPDQPFGEEMLVDAPKLAVDQDDRLHLAFTVGGPFRESSVAHARGSAETLSFDEPVTLSGAGGPTPAAYPQLAVAGDYVVVIWEALSGAGQHPDRIGQAVSTVGGEHFSGPDEVETDRLPGSARSGGNQGLLFDKLTVDDAGRVLLGHAVWLEDEDETRIELLRGRIDRGE